jgi:hypothetical protein
MLTIATAIINGNALWKIILASLVGGAGAAIAFGFLLIGLSRASKSPGPAARFVNYLVASSGGLFCVAAVVAGVYMMADK